MATALALAVVAVIAAVLARFFVDKLNIWMRCLTKRLLLSQLSAYPKPNENVSRRSGLVTSTKSREKSARLQSRWAASPLPDRWLRCRNLLSLFSRLCS